MHTRSRIFRTWIRWHGFSVSPDRKGGVPTTSDLAGTPPLRSGLMERYHFSYPFTGLICHVERSEAESKHLGSGVIEIPRLRFAMLEMTSQMRRFLNPVNGYPFFPGYRLLATGYLLGGFEKLLSSRERLEFSLARRRSKIAAGVAWLRRGRFYFDNAASGNSSRS